MGAGTLNIENMNTRKLALDLGAGSTLEQYIMVYLKNTGADQTSTDAGKTISGTVTVTASTGSQVQATFQ